MRNLQIPFTPAGRGRVRKPQGLQLFTADVPACVLARGEKGICKFHSRPRDAGGYESRRVSSCSLLTVGNIVLEDISATSAKAVYSFRGYTTEPIRGLRLKNIKVGKAKNPSSAELVEDISVVDTPSFRCLRKVGMVIQFGNGMRTSYTELLCLI